MRNAEYFMNKKFRIALQYDSDGYWIAENPELPGCKADGETPQEAISSLEISRQLWIESRLGSGLEIPEPQEAAEYSGRFVLRIAKSMHRELAEEAESEGISLNSLVGKVLAGRHSEKQTRGKFELSKLCWGESAFSAFDMPRTPQMQTNKARVSPLIAIPGGQSPQAGHYQSMTADSEQMPVKVPQYA